jgi:hypothetical protein
MELTVYKFQKIFHSLKRSALKVEAVSTYNQLKVETVSTFNQLKVETVFTFSQLKVETLKKPSSD